MEKLKNSDPYVNDKSHKLIDLMKLLEIFTGKEIHTLQNTVIHRFETIEELCQN